MTNKMLLNSVPDNKILDLSKLKAFADISLNVNKNLKIALGRAENIVEKGENFPLCFQKAFSLGSLKVRLCGKELTLYPATKLKNELN